MKMIDVVKIKQSELLALPQKPFNEIRTYNYIMICPTKKKHDSGWRLMALIGGKKVDGDHYEPVEVIGYCDDVNWILPPDAKYFEALRTDMTLSNCIRVWSNCYEFQVGCVTSSTDVHVIKTECKR